MAAGAGGRTAWTACRTRTPSPAADVASARRLREERRTGPGDLLDVAVVRSTAAAHHVEVLEPALEPPVLRAQLDRVAGVERRGLVQLGVALGRRVGSNATQPVQPPRPWRQDVLEVGGVRPLEAVVDRRSCGLGLVLLDGFA